MASLLPRLGALDGTDLFEEKTVSLDDCETLVREYLEVRLGMLGVLKVSGEGLGKFPSLASADSLARERKKKLIQQPSLSSFASLSVDSFARHRFLQQILDGDVPAEQVLPVLQKCLSRPVKLTENSDFDNGVPINVLYPSPPLLIDEGYDYCLPGDASALAALEELAIPSREEDEDAYESSWATVKALHGEESTKIGMKSLRNNVDRELDEDDDENSSWSPFEARSLVVRVLAWRDFFNRY